MKRQELCWSLIDTSIGSSPEFQRRNIQKTSIQWEAICIHHHLALYRSFSPFVEKKKKTIRQPRAPKADLNESSIARCMAFASDSYFDYGIAESTLTPAHPLDAPTAKRVLKRRAPEIIRGE